MGDPLEQVKKLREEYERALDVAESQRAAYHEAVLDLYRRGTPLREIAKELGLSHQRVHQIVSGEPPRRKKLPRAAGGIGAALVLVAATFGALRIAHAPPFVQGVPVPTAEEATACLTSHGWIVARQSESSGTVIAAKAHYRLYYQPSRDTGPIVQTTRNGYGPKAKHTPTGEGATKATSIHGVVPACFQQFTRSIHSFASSTQVAHVTPSSLAGHSGDVVLAGTVVGEPHGDPYSSNGLRFLLANTPSKNAPRVWVVYRGSVPRLFKAGLTVAVEGKLRNGLFLSRPASLVTKNLDSYVPVKPPNA